MDDHHPKCSWRQTNGCILCDCDVLNKEYDRRKEATQDPFAKFCAVCMHEKKDHIYEEGACRPGFGCNCGQFTARTSNIDAKRYALNEDCIE